MSKSLDLDTFTKSCHIFPDDIDDDFLEVGLEKERWVAHHEVM